MKYITAGARMIALVSGLTMFGAMTLLLYSFNIAKPWAWGMIAGASIALIIVLIIAWRNYREHMKFMEAQSRVGGHLLEFSLATVCTYTFTRRAYAFFSDSQIRLFLWEKRPYLESTIWRDDVVLQYAACRPNCIVLTFQDEPEMLLIIPDALKVINTMKECGYHTEEIPDYV